MQRKQTAAATSSGSPTRRIGVRGDVSEGGALRYFKRLGEGRYDMADLARATEKLARFVGDVAGEAETLGLGYSNGANILASVLFAAPERFGTAVLMHPLIPFTPKPQPGLAGRRVHDPAPRSVCSDTTCGRSNGYAAVSQIHDRLGLVYGIRYT